jgi:hypothetical protein
MARIKKAARELLQEHTDYTTGEVKSDSRQQVGYFETEPNFVKIYLQDILYLKDVPKGLNAILYFLIRRIDYYNQIIINSAVKRQIAEETGLSFSRVNSAVTEFVKGKILIRKDVGIYTANPYLFGKGKWEDIKKIRTVVEYSIHGKTFHSEIIKNQDELMNDAKQNI